MSHPKYLTIDEVSEITGLTRQHLAYRRLKKLPPSYIKVGRLVRYCYDDVISWMESQRVNAWTPEKVRDLSKTIKSAIADLSNCT